MSTTDLVVVEPHDEAPEDEVTTGVVRQTLAAQAFLCDSADAYVYGVEMLKAIKRGRKVLKEHFAESIEMGKVAIRSAKAAADAAWQSYEDTKASAAASKETWKGLDRQLEAGYENVLTSCEAWIANRRLQQSAALAATSQSLTKTPEAIAAHLDTAFDAAMASGDEGKAARVMELAALPAELVQDQITLGEPLPPPPTEDVFIPKVPGASVSVPNTWELLDYSKLPMSYLMPDRQKITALVKSTDVATAQRILGPGVHVRVDTSLRVSEKR